MAGATMTYGLAMAAAHDAGNRHMQAAGRSKWAVADWNHACETFSRLWPEPEIAIPGDCGRIEASEPRKRTRTRSNRLRGD